MVRFIYENEEPTRSCLAPNRLRRSFRLIGIMTLVLTNDVITLYLSFEKALADVPLDVNKEQWMGFVGVQRIDKTRLAITKTSGLESNTSTIYFLH